MVNSEIINNVPNMKKITENFKYIYIFFFLCIYPLDILVNELQTDHPIKIIEI